MKRIFFPSLMLLLALALASCGSASAPNPTPESGSAPENPPSSPGSIRPASPPQICNCVLRFDHIGIEQGLSQSSALDIFQDSRGFLWFGTQDGLNRYDGYSFEIYKPDPDVPNSLSDRWITAIIEDRNGYLWIATRLGGLNRFDPRTEKFTSFTHNDADLSTLSDNHVNTLLLDTEDRLWIGTATGLDLYNPQSDSFRHYTYNSRRSNALSGRNVSAIYEDSHGKFWVGTFDGGLNGFDPKSGTFRHYQNDPEDESTLSSDRVRAIEEDANGVLWVGTGDGLNQFHPDTGQFTRFLHSNNDPFSLADNTVNVLYTDSAGNLWIGTRNGLDRLRQGDMQFIHYVNEPGFARSLSQNIIVSIYEDRGGVLWFGTAESGVNKYDPQRNRFAYYRNDPNNPESLNSNSIYPILEDHEGYIWIGTQGQGLNKFNVLTGTSEKYRFNPDNPNSLVSDTVTSLYQDHLDDLWIGTNRGLDRFTPKTNTFSHLHHDQEDASSLASDYIDSIFEDSRNQLWVGTFAGLERYDRENGTFIHYRTNEKDPTTISGGQVGAIYEDQQGFLWFGTFEKGLNRYDPRIDQFTRFRADPQNKQSLSSDSILSIYQDTKGRLWIGTAGGGLNLYHPDTNSFTYYLEKNGLPNGVVYGILEDDSGYLWLSTNYGLSRFDPESRTFRNFDAEDGLQSNEFNSSAYAKGRDGVFYFGGVNGLTVFHPSNITDNPYPPQIALTSLTSDGKAIVTGGNVESTTSITLRYPQNSFEFEFASLSFNQSDKNRYAYFLEGFDHDWNLAGTKRDGRYTNLPGGTYTLLLKATNSDGIWNETPIRIQVTIIPPFWQMLSFRVAIVILFVAVVAASFRLRTRSIQDRNRALEKLVRERTYALEKRGREMEALYQADEKILRTVSLNQVFQTLVDVAVDLLHADRSIVFAWDETQTKVVPRVSHGFLPETLEVMEFARGEGIIGEVLTTGKPAIVRQIDLDSFRPDIRAAILAEGIRSFVHLPIIVDHKVVGVFNIGFTKPDLLGDDTMRLFSALVNRAAISIANMELFEQTKDLAVMEERNRLARDLHDSAKQKAFAALAQLGTARGILNGNGNSVSVHLSEAENLVSDVIQELTFLVQEIYPVALQEKGLATALRDYIFEWENRNGMIVQFIARNERRLPLEIEQAIYRITQESLANVARHSQAKRVDMSLVYNGDSIQLSLSDDGRGFDVQARSHGMGLRSIRERVSSIRGTVQIQSAPGHGTRILIQVPAKG